MITCQAVHQCPNYPSLLFHLLPAMVKPNTLTLCLLVDTAANRLVLAEVDKDFVGILLAILTLIITWIH